jgi:hypothetical protein
MDLGGGKLDHGSIGTGYLFCEKAPSAAYLMKNRPLAEPL